MTIEWICKHHSDLGKEQLYAILQLRAQVFVVEQQCAYQDVDGQDLEGDTCHLMAWDEPEPLAMDALRKQLDRLDAAVLALPLAAALSVPVTWWSCTVRPSHWVRWPGASSSDSSAGRVSGCQVARR